MPISLDIRTGVQTAVILAAIFAILSLISGALAVSKARHVPYFRMRREKMVLGWRSIVGGIGLIIIAFLLNTYAEPTAYSFFPPSPTLTLTRTTTLTPTITLSPTITLTPSITNTPSVSNTPTITPTPHIPLAIEAQFEGQLTPPADAVFSKMQFTNQGIDSLYRPINPDILFTNPVGEMYAFFTYDGMVDGTQWTALWFRDGKIIHFETNPWDGGSGGAGFSDLLPDAEFWLPGEYQVQIFIGYDWQRSGFFTVEGDPPTSTPTPTQTATRVPTNTPTPVTPTFTPTPTVTKTATTTPIPPTPTLTRWPTATKITPTLTFTRWPTPSLTPIP
ncbi:MAG: hypothetical protein ABFS03_10010 [Chloroflexota bacterium]